MPSYPVILSLILFTLCNVSLSPAFATSVTCSAAKPCVIQWNANTEPDLKEYRLYLSQVAGQYGPVPKIVIPKPTAQLSSISLGALLDGVYFVTLTALDLGGNESAKSNEVSFTYDGIPAAPVITISVTVP